MTLPPIRQGSSYNRLIELCNEMLAKRRLIFVSNRGPVEYHVDQADRLQVRRGSGGVVTALSALSQYVEFTWIASAMGEGDRRAAEKAPGKHLRPTLAGQKLCLRFVPHPRDVYHKYYNIFCNPLLWFLQHYMWNSPYTPTVDARVHDAWENGYVPANQAFAQAVIAEAAESDHFPFVMLHDYHLYLAAGYIRSQMPHVILQHFTHIPWPSPEYWHLLPNPIRKSILEGLCANDIVGLQATRDVRNFLHTCEAFLDGARVDHQNHKVWTNGHLTTVCHYPISINPFELHKLARLPQVKQYEEKLRPYCGEQTIVRVDRAEPSKNIVRGFKAFDLLLQRYPDLVGKVNFLIFLVPSRTHIGQYRRYTQQVMDIVATINTKYGNEKWQPIKIFYENNYLQAIAGMQLYDVLLVNPVIDGMNLVAKEGPTVNTRNGVLVLSEGAGAYEQLQENVLSVAPADVEGTIEALRAALSMPHKERKRRATALKKSVEEQDVTAWLCQQFEGLRNLGSQLRLPTT